MREGRSDLQELLPDAQLEHLADLGGSDRSQVRRVRAVSPTATRTLIVKTFTGSGEGWVRECAALSIMPPGAPTPRLVAAGDAPPIVVMSDAGPGASLADVLLGRDPAAAADAVLLWAEAIAGLHRATAGSRADFGAQLSTRAGDWPVAESTVSTDLDDTARSIAGHCAELGIDVPAGALAELRALGRRLSGDGAAAITPADACPDNNVRVDDQLVLIDFEGGQWRHIAWDVAYLSVPWPSCWCSWRIPGEVGERAVERYRTAVADVLPYASTPQFRLDVAAATVGWAFVSASWFLPRALADDPPLGDPTKPTPTRRAMILHRLDGARQAAELPALARLADVLHTELARRWGESPLAYAPAFRSNG